MLSIGVPSKDQPANRPETVEEFLARGGRIKRIEDHPLPDGRVLLRSWPGRNSKTSTGARAASARACK
jgi:hypothetical protein